MTVNQLIGKDRVFTALDLVSRVGWISHDLLAAWIWGDEGPAASKARQLTVRMTKEGLLLPRKITANLRVFVLSKQGADASNRMGIEAARPGTRWGRAGIYDDWHAPPSWRHDWMAARYLMHLHKQGYHVTFQNELQRLNAHNQALSDKIPDGVAWLDLSQVELSHGLVVKKRSSLLWIEVESERKTGQDMQQLVDTITSINLNRYMDSLIVRGEQDKVYQAVPSEAILVLPPEGKKDSRGYAIDHVKRVLNAIQRLNLSMDDPSDTLSVRFSIDRGQGNYEDLLYPIELIRPEGMDDY